MGMQNILKSMDDTWMPCINRLLKYVLTVKRSEKERIPKSEMITAPFQHLLKTRKHMEIALLDLKCCFLDVLPVSLNIRIIFKILHALTSNLTQICQNCYYLLQGHSFFA